MLKDLARLRVCMDSISPSKAFLSYSCRYVLLVLWPSKNGAQCLTMRKRFQKTQRLVSSNGAMVCFTRDKMLSLSPAGGPGLRSVPGRGTRTNPFRGGPRGGLSVDPGSSLQQRKPPSRGTTRGSSALRYRRLKLHMHASSHSDRKPIHGIVFSYIFYQPT